MQGLQSGLAPDTWRKCERSPISSCPVLLDSMGFQHVWIHLSVSQWNVHFDGLFQELPAFTHITSSLSPFPVHVHLPHPLLWHASSPLLKATHSSTLPLPHTRTTSMSMEASEDPVETHGAALTATSAPNSPSSPLPSLVPPPFTFLKCYDGVEISCLSQLSLAHTSRQFQLPSNVSASALCSIVPARLFPQTSIVHYSRLII